tara:strand:- start:1113378 stop:1113836 length:459 start_codon:yes stop_codon:yes gene_type:complete
MSENRVIGSGDGMPWNVPEEYEQYLNFVDGNTVVMGRRTYEVFGKDLPKDTHAVVLSRRATFDGTTSAASFDDAIDEAAKFGTPVFIAGGGFVYEQAIPVVDEMYLSTIKGEYQGDVYFPKFDADLWHVAETRNETNFVFHKYRRRKSVESR